MRNFGNLIAAVRRERKISQLQLAKALNVTKQTISNYERGERRPDYEMLEAIADVLNVPMGFFLTPEEQRAELDALRRRDGEESVPHGLVPVTLHKIPILGNVAAGKPIYSDEPIETYVDSADHKADFALVVKGDSMDPLYKDGDIVYIRSQSDVRDGQIAAVGVDDEATLKRVYHTPNGLQLLSINPAYPPMLFTEQNSDDLRIFGLAVGYYRKTI